ncbi:tryptophan halogenase family protein [Pseudoalteromonas denitrificans]|uniref:Tryptophan halogenase n=1 Tax=Pseudoalteromonas denitrificans DSM 6059 TaxID=1123010 RepID=A0A1I1KVT2_9GAMM|nr:tryptophan halogenase family protein [Pseudoalteromonas denitrificans]SFC64914.1 tryptophan halogenase [Pseudoalteromonas denitrificans DSM 6059]
MKIKRIAIIGGGTAGWLAANHLGVELNADPEIEITVLESKDVPSIGVGEGTVPYLMKGLKRFGISEAQLLLSCDATFKQGIKFVNWLDPESHGENYYYHPFDTPYPGGFDISPFWVSQGEGRPFDDVGIQARICELGLSPKRKNSGEYLGDLAYAYHFNATKFATLLAENAQKRFNVVHEFATIVGVKKDDKANISHLLTDTGSELPFDFYVDCSGFSSILIDKELKVPFVSKAKELLTDTVLVQQMPLVDDENINPYTTATAHKAGWIWDIPLINRRGTGFVYSSQHMSDTEALSLYAEYLNVPKDSISPRKISMDIGYRKEFWSKNCVALGLAQGFLEPLEATSILISDFSAELLARNFPRYASDIDISIPYYNKVVTYVWEKVVDFIKLHYCISDRRDSQFWLDNQKPDTISEELKARLQKFKLQPPQQSDFFSRFDLFDDKNFLYVLYGMKFDTKSTKLTQMEIEQSYSLIKSNDVLVNKADKYLMPHKDWLMGLKAAVAKN